MMVGTAKLGERSCLPSPPAQAGNQRRMREIPPWQGAWDGHGGEHGASPHPAPAWNRWHVSRIGYGATTGKGRRQPGCIHGQLGGDSPAGRGTSPGGPWSPSSPQPAAARSCPPAGVGEGRALSGMPVWLSESTALGANSLQLGFESMHPAGAD